MIDNATKIMEKALKQAEQEITKTANTLVSSEQVPLRAVFMALLDVAAKLGYVLLLPQDVVAGTAACVYDDNKQLLEKDPVNMRHRMETVTHYGFKTVEEAEEEQRKKYHSYLIGKETPKFVNKDTN